MATNQRYTHNDHIALTADKAYTSGQPVKIGQYVGVSLTTVAKGEKVSLWLDGSWTLEVDGALTEGQAVYIKPDGTLTATAAGASPYGLANAPKGAGKGPAEVAPFGMLIPASA